MSELKEEYSGQRFRVVHCEGAMDSFAEALRHVPAHEQAAKTRGIINLINRLADGHRMSGDSFPAEGKLPKNAGQFNAFKRQPVRAYVWRSKRHRNTYFISHYVHKDYKKLKGADEDRVGKNWIRVEEEGHER